MHKLDEGNEVMGSLMSHGVHVRVKWCTFTSKYYVC